MSDPARPLTFEVYGEQGVLKFADFDSFYAHLLRLPVGEDAAFNMRRWDGDEAEMIEARAEWVRGGPLGVGDSGLTLRIDMRPPDSLFPPEAE